MPVTRIAKTNTYTRIIDASLALFNEEGERNISTNHIAAHLGISPGNLYYHFRNKDEIIVQLFKRYSEALLAYLNEAVLPSDVEDSINYMAGIYDVMWEYRFLFSDVNTLLARSAEL
ncbi:TetR/AcrR family transcriptional regulator, partial [Neisseria gonorrhoeae]